MEVVQFFDCAWFQVRTITFKYYITVKLTRSLPEFSSIPAGELQTTFPNPPLSTSPLRFALLRTWLQSCDKYHNQCKHIASRQECLPTRLLDLSNPDSLKLVPGQEVSFPRYIALSHRWGESDKTPSYRTTNNNIHSREKGSNFHVSDLPLTFRDAIKVSQGLGIHYLWIDSLCIIQDCKEDWAKESRRMEDVYAGAYCTIAATSATNSQEGFLGQDIDSKHVFVYDNDNPSQRAYARIETANFDREVDGAQLNQRGWVLQERLLSRRTVHFGSSEMYFECGYGRYGEDLTRMERYETPNPVF